MPFQAVPDTVEVLVSGTFNGIPWQNTFYYNYVTPPDEEQLGDLLDDLNDVITSDWLPLMPANVAVTSLYARDLASEVAAQALLGLIGSVGSASGAALPTFNSLAISRRSGFTGRSARGRIFWVGFTEAQVSDNTVDGTVLNDIVAAIEAFDAAANLASFTPVIVSRYTAGALRPTGVTFDIQTWFATDNKVDTRRSRKAQ